MTVTVGEHEILERIGKGSFGEVFRGRHISTNTTVAIKVIDLEQAEDEIEDIQHEIAVMAQCDSPHVTRYFGSYVLSTRLYLIMEYVGGGSVLVRSPGKNMLYICARRCTRAKQRDGRWRLRTYRHTPRPI